MTKLLALALWIDFSQPAAGGVYQSSVSVGPSLTFPGAYTIATATEPAFAGDGAGLELSVDSHRVLRPVEATVGIGHVWFSTVNGVVIDPAFTASATPFANAFTYDLSGQIQLTSGQSFLLAFWLDATRDSIPDAGDRFGWARLSYTTASGLTLLDNAIEDTGVGIIAGTTTTAPEPGSALLLLAGGALLTLRRRRG